MINIKKMSNTKNLEDKYGIKVKIIDITPNTEELITFSALVSFWEEWSGDKYELINKSDVEKHLPLLMMAGHHSILEHAKVTFVIEGCSRSCLAQITRHRHASFTVQSQRFVKIDKPEYVIPDTIRQNPEALKKYEELMEKIWDTYRELIDMGVPKEDARMVLPNATRTKMTVTMNFRELLHVMQLRMCYHAQWEIRDIMWALWEQLMQVAPHVFIHGVPPCVKKGFCPYAPVDKHLYCGVMNEVFERYKRTLKELGFDEDDLVHKSFYTVNRRKML